MLFVFINSIFIPLCFLLLELACSNIFLDITVLTFHLIAWVTVLSYLRSRDALYMVFRAYKCTFVNASFWNLVASRFKLLFCTSTARFYFDYFRHVTFYFFPFFYLFLRLMILLLLSNV